MSFAKVGNTLFLAVLLAGVIVAGAHVSLGLYHLAAISLFMASVGAGVVALEQSPALAQRVLPDLALRSRTAQAPVASAAVRAIGVVGNCAWGYRAGGSWAIDARGSVSPALCRAAMEAIAPLLTPQAPAGQGVRAAACRCPLAGRQVAFAVA
ncbi:MAG: hypothetical protein HYY02_13930 [Chloroflexi bacterium]|nr:hypothetical protein [Chloroflexota bacterium]